MNSSTVIRKSFRRTVLASVVALGAFGASNSFAAESTTTATGTVIAPIAITNPVNLNFGRFVAGVAVGTVKVDTNGSRTATGDAFLPTVGPTPTAAQFLVTGGADATYTISWTGAVLTNTTGAGAETMTLARISDLTGGGGASADVLSGALSAGGDQTIYLGGTLSVGAAQVAGVYTGDVTATVEYN
ncbi:DUF4402 domain-containing protein [Halomonas sp. M5N1S17]|uniref:DUF4402 domain-containing protein n=1 Tax=Halomonas alkalisoli TaxID=2907158 RepID=UPI001F44CE79|nr:DUF4402 domain-containing protein [Halomonas alkalisoli]MCE9661951.1 DUF4402 domain-containing protein [Halomonas alkalisoli]